MASSRGTILRAAGVVAALLLAAGIISPAFGAKALNKGKVKKISRKQATNQINTLVPGLITQQVPTAGNPLFIQETELVRFSLTANQGANPTLITHGPLTVKGECIIDGTNLEGNAFLETTEDGTAFGGDGGEQGSVGPTTPLANRYVKQDDAQSAGAPDHSYGYDDQWSAIAPSGKAINGTISIVAHKDAGTCKFYGHALLIG